MRRTGILRPAQRAGEATERLGWAGRERLKRVFGIEVEHCERCGGRLKIIASIEEPSLIEKILQHLQEEGRIPSRPPPHAAPRRACGRGSKRHSEAAACRATLRRSAASADSKRATKPRSYDTHPNARVPHPGGRSHRGALAKSDPATMNCAVPKRRA